MSPSPPLRALFFDLDETLLDDAASMRESLDATCRLLATRYHGIEPIALADAYTRVADVFWADYGSNPGSQGWSAADIRAEVWTRALATCHASLSKLGIEAGQLYGQERAARHRLFPDVLPLLDSLPSGLVLGVITNGAEDGQMDKLVRVGIEKRFAAVAISGRVGVGKPNAGIFESALAAAGVSANEAMHVGDSLVNDVGGALGAGMTAVWLNRSRQARPPAAATPHAEVPGLADLQALVCQRLAGS